MVVARMCKQETIYYYSRLSVKKLSSPHSKRFSLETLPRNVQCI